MRRNWIHMKKTQQFVFSPPKNHKASAGFPFLILAAAECFLHDGFCEADVAPRRRGPQQVVLFVFWFPVCSAFRLLLTEYQLK